MARRSGRSGGDENLVINLTVSGKEAVEQDIKSFIRSLNTMLKGAGRYNLNEYFDSAKSSIESVKESLSAFINNMRDADAAGNFLKSYNSYIVQFEGGLDAAAEHIKSEFGNEIAAQVKRTFDSVVSAAEEANQGVANAFSTDRLPEAFSALKYLIKDLGLDLTGIFKAVNAGDTDAVANRIKKLESSLSQVNYRLDSTKEKLREMTAERDKALSGEMYDELNDKLENLQGVVAQSKEEFRGFLTSLGYDWLETQDDGKFSKYFSAIENGVMTAQQAITKFREENKSLGQELSSDSLNQFLSKLNEILTSLSAINDRLGAAGGGTGGVASTFSGSADAMSDAANAANAFTSAFAKTSEQLASITEQLQEIIRLVGELNDKEFNIQNITKAVEDPQVIRVYGEEARALSEYLIELSNNFTNTTNASRGMTGVLLTMMDQFAKIDSFNPTQIAKSLNDAKATSSGLAQITEQLKEYKNAFMELINALHEHGVDVPLPDDTRIRAAADGVREFEEQTERTTAATTEMAESVQLVAKNTAELSLGKITGDESGEGFERLSDILQEINTILPSIRDNMQSAFDVTEPLTNLQTLKDTLDSVVTEQKVKLTVDQAGLRMLRDSVTEAVQKVSQNIKLTINNVEVTPAAQRKLSRATSILGVGKALQLDETSLSSLSQTIQDAIQKASQNIKLTIEHVQLSAGALKDISDQVAAEASGTKTKTKTDTGGATKAVKENTEALQENASAQEAATHAAKDTAEANNELAESARNAASAEKEIGDSGAGEINIAYVQQLIKLYEQLSVWKTKNDAAYKDNQAVVDSIMAGTKNAITEAQGAIDSYLANVRESGTVTEETFIGVRAAIAQITGETAARNAEITAASKAAEDAAKKQKIAVQEIVDLYDQWYSAEANKLNAAKQHENGEVEYWRKQQNELKVLVDIAEEAYPELAKLAKANDTVTAAIEKRDKAQRTLDSKRSKETVAQIKANADELEKYRQQLEKLNNWKGLDFVTDSQSMDRWNEEVERTQEILQRLSKAEGKARIPIIDELKNQLSTLRSIREEFNKVAEFTNTLNGIGANATNMKFGGDNDAVQRYETQVQKVIAAINNLRTANAGQATEAVAGCEREINALRELKKSLEDAAAGATALENSQQRATKLVDKIDIWKSKNPNAYKNAKDQVDAWLSTLTSGAKLSKEELDAISSSFDHVANKEKEAGNNGQTFFQTLKAGWSKFGGWSIVSRSFMMVIRTFKNAVTAVKEIDAAMTELKKVTNETETGYRKFYETATQMASKVGAKLSDTIMATSDFARLGFSINEASQLAESALLYKNIGDGIEDVSAATESLISTMKAFHVQAEDSISIVDMFNEVNVTCLHI